MPQIRQRLEQQEHLILCEWAAYSDCSRGRLAMEEESDLRTCFQRDRDRILHSKSFRRLKHKTQVFLSPEGDHYRTRLTHTLEVSQIARVIARALQLNEDLTEAIALGHDLGHTPFGHAGERALNRICDGGFRHYEQSLRVVDQLEKKGKGLNLTYEVRDGILHHTTGQQPFTMEGKLVRVCDRIAYINHDIDDAIHAGVLSGDDIPKPIRDCLGNKKSTRIDTMVRSVVLNSTPDKIQMDETTNASFQQLHTFLFETVYTGSKAKSEEDKVDGLIEYLFSYYVKHPEQLPEGSASVAETDGVERAVCDYIAGMTDRYAIQKFQEIYVPKSWAY